MSHARSYTNLASAVVLVNLAWLLPILATGFFWACAFALTAYKAVILTDMWCWFAVPAGFKPLSFVQAIGLMTIVSFLTLNPLSVNNPKDDTKSKWVQATGNLIIITIWATLCWGGAYVWHWYLG